MYPRQNASGASTKNYHEAIYPLLRFYVFNGLPHKKTVKMSFSPVSNQVFSEKTRWFQLPTLLHIFFTELEHLIFSIKTLYFDNQNLRYFVREHSGSFTIWRYRSLSIHLFFLQQLNFFSHQNNLLALHWLINVWLAVQLHWICVIVFLAHCTSVAGYLDYWILSFWLSSFWLWPCFFNLDWTPHSLALHFWFFSSPGLKRSLATGNDIIVIVDVCLETATNEFVPISTATAQLKNPGSTPFQPSLLTLLNTLCVAQLTGSMQAEFERLTQCQK